MLKIILLGWIAGSAVMGHHFTVVGMTWWISCGLSGVFREDRAGSEDRLDAVVADVGCCSCNI